ncbi:hypothetical protein MKW98_026005 [Papaver atlanticum]|uniref:Uncharacterized protein n=1 Tax=Papaver atlanticum TaxID=357466 RepID=A0AAD4RYU7_9MAGN|nr:hypothetical protein MKW98_026005 [Papaver atlanticum]
MSGRILQMIGSQRSRSTFSSAVTRFRSASPLLSSPETKVLFRVKTQLSGALEKKNKPHFPTELTQLKKDPTKEQLVMGILRDFVKKHSGVDDFDSELLDLLGSDRLKDLGVGYKEIPIPDMHEWKASWYEERKPNWLGSSTDADSRLHYTASITGYLEKEGRKGGYGVIFFDNYGRPKVASVGVSPKGYVPLLYHQLQGVRSALQLALDYGFSSEITLYCNSGEVRYVLDRCLESLKYVPMCMAGDFLRLSRDDTIRWRAEAHHCNACVLHDLYHQMEDFDLLYPVIDAILTLFSKLNHFRNVSPSKCSASNHLAKLYGMPTTEEMNLFRLLDDKQELYEMVMKPDKFPKELDDILYDEVFKGDRIHSQEIMLTEATAGMDPVTLYKKLTRPSFA